MTERDWLVVALISWFVFCVAIGFVGLNVWVGLGIFGLSMLVISLWQYRRDVKKWGRRSR